jgi:hypothetical protein
MLSTTEQYALVEASYTTAKLLQRFNVLGNAELDRSLEPKLQANLVFARRNGVNVRLYSTAHVPTEEKHNVFIG